MRAMVSLAGSRPGGEPPDVPSKSALSRYRAAVEAQLAAAFESQTATIDAVADAVAAALAARRWIWFAGTGHSHLLALEMFYRAGGLVRAVPILDEELMLHVSASRSTEHERESGRAARLLARDGVGAGDVLFVISNSGRNAVPVEFALEGRRLGARVVALTNLRHSNAHASRHPSGKRLAEVADLVLDNQGIEGDAVVPVGAGGELRVGATSTVVGAALLEAIVAEAVSRAMAAGVDVEVYRSSNGGGEAVNRRYLAEYVGKIPRL
ncbi:MAG: SIS domain-containing protein [Verrucomicrobia bacterium]|nr:MAG: SIS domain-containing protein [Verrucomicrobiota bacterium]